MSSDPEAAGTGGMGCEAGPLLAGEEGPCAGQAEACSDAAGWREQEAVTLPVLLFLEHHVNMRPDPDAPPLLLPITDTQPASEARGVGVLGRRALALAAAECGEQRASIRSAPDQCAPDEAQPPTATPTPAPEERRQNAEEGEEGGAWPHSMAPALAALSCTVGLFNLSRFALFSVHFGANFVVQFAVLSLGAGVPLYALHASLGRVLACGVLGMWRISPVLRGVGAALLAAQALLALYSVVGVSWLLVYFRDSFITADDQYRWASCSASGEWNSSVQECVPRYWREEVLQQHSHRTALGPVRFQTAFNLAVVWLIVFVALSKGLRSYCKAVYVVTLAPACGALALAAKLITLAPTDAGGDLLAQTEWSEFFFNTNSWAAATQEVFLTWGLLGACVMQLAARGGGGGSLRVRVACAAAGTLALLLLAALLGNACVAVLRARGYLYLPVAFESVSAGQFVWPAAEPLPSALAATPVRHLSHYGGVLGVTVWRAGGGSWQPLQLATQLVPAALAALSARELSPVWAVLFYSVLILLGVGQQLALWHCVVSGVVEINSVALKPWETSITFFSCLIGLFSGLVLATDGGVRVVHWLDYVVAGAWWQCALHTLLVCGVFLVRGRPYSADTVVATLVTRDSRLSAALATLLGFLWTLVLPVLMVALCVVDFRTGRQRQLYAWRREVGACWPVWARRCGAALQQAVLLLVPLVAAVQTYRYVNKGPPDIFDRIQNLYRPRMEGEESVRVVGEESAEAGGEEAAAPDPPPKYTPPPSYSTATGARLLATLRRSFRAVRRLASSPWEPLPPPPASAGESLELGAGPPARARRSLSVNRGAAAGAGAVRRLRSSLRGSFKFSTRSESCEGLARGAEPASATEPASITESASAAAPIPA